MNLTSVGRAASPRRCVPLAIFAAWTAALAACGDDFTKAEDDTAGADAVLDSGTVDVLDVLDVAPDATDDVAETTPDGTDDGGTDGGGTDDGGEVDGAPACPGQLGCACAEDKDCGAGVCQPDVTGAKVCYPTCATAADCPTPGALCQTLPNTTKAICVPVGITTDAPCGDKILCGFGDVAGVCASYGAAGSFCRPGCQQDGDCKGGATCVEGNDFEGKAVKFCKLPGDVLPTCTGFAAAIGTATSCYAPTLPGCKAPRKCIIKDSKPELEPCAPAAPATEVCDNIDQDCDGATDDGAVCDDGKLCSDDLCKDGACQVTWNTAPCDDGDVCTLSDACKDGACLPGAATKACDDGNPCTNDGCDPKTGCTVTNNSAPCDDGSVCTTGDTCDGQGACAGKAIDCEDGNACTDNPCDAKAGCGLPVNTTKTCDDGDACTEQDQCDGAGKCASVKVNCEDGNTCTDNPCDAKMGCGLPVNSTKTCDDGDACTEKDQCDGMGACKAAKLNCEDGDQCTDDPCDSKSGCAAKVLNTKPCSDAANCKVGGTCDGKGKCAGLKDACDDGSPCTIDACAGAGKGCTHNVGNQGGACDDGDACSVSDACKDGKCVGTAKECKDNNPCTVDACVGGACSFAVSSCEDGLPCTDDPCDPATSKCGLKILTKKPCNDGNLCDGPDACDGKGTCVGGAKVVCDDKNPCTTDACDAKLGCVATPAAGVACSDGNPCSSGDACDAKGACVAKVDGSGKPCDDGSSCTKDDACDKVLGCVGAPVPGCGTIAPAALPFADALDCPGPATPVWLVPTAPAGKNGWRIDKLPGVTGLASDACSLNFNNDKDYVCEGSDEAVGPGVVPGPMVDATKVAKPTLSFWLAGTWETGTCSKGPSCPLGYYDALQVMVQELKDGQPVGAPTQVALPTSPGLTGKVIEVDLSAYAGKTFGVAFQFSTADCFGNSGTGPHIKNVKLFDGGCKDASACDDGNSCTTDTCEAGGCKHTNNTELCDDGQVCTAKDACKDGKCAGTAVVCDDGDACTGGETCSEAAKGCKAGFTKSCDDFDPCTADSCDGKTGACGHSAIDGCAPACKVDADCASSDVCKVGACDGGTGKCSFGKAKDGVVCGNGQVCGAGVCVASSAGWAVSVHGNPTGDFFCALTTSATVACWGKNDQGQIGNGASGDDVPQPTLVKDLKDVVQVAVGGDHACARTKDGKTWCWGDDLYGQLGDGKSSDSGKPVEATEIKGAVDVAAGTDFTCWIDKDAMPFCLGYNGSGRLGIDSTSSSGTKTATAIKGLKDAAKIMAAYYTGCVLHKDRTVSCWGYNFDKELADTSTSTYYAPVARAGATGVFAIDGSYASISWATGAGAWSVGDNSDGQLGKGDLIDSPLPVQVLGPMAHIVAVPGGDNHHLALTSTGEVWGAGQNATGQLGLPGAADVLTYQKLPFPPVVSIDASSVATCAVTTAGAVVCVGSNSDGQLGGGPGVPSGSKLVTTIGFCKQDGDCDDGSPCTSNACKDGGCTYQAAGTAPCDDGDVCTDKDACKDGVCAGAAKDCADGDACTVGERCVILASKAVCVVGASKACDDGKPCTTDACDAKTGACVATPIADCAIGCKTDADCGDDDACTSDTCKGGACSYTAAADGLVCGAGSVCSQGACGPISAGWARAIDGSPDGKTFCARTAEGTLACWGAGTNGVLGNGTTTDSSTPVFVKDLNKVTQFDVGGDHACAIADGKLWCWGDNAYGCLADGKTPTDSSVPVEAKQMPDAVQVCVGNDFTCSRDAKGQVLCAGYNSNGELGIGSTTSSTTVKPPVQPNGLPLVVDIACSSNSVCAKAVDGGIWCWGDNSDKETSASAGSTILEPMLIIEGATRHSFGLGSNAHCLLSGGNGACQGDNLYGQLGNGTTTDSAVPVPIVGPGALVRVVGGLYHLVALDTSGTPWAAGDNFYGQLGDGTTTAAKAFGKMNSGKAVVVDIAATTYASCGILASGQVWCVGQASNGQLGNGTTSPNALVAVEVAAPCQNDKQCDDGNLCTTDACDGAKKVCTFSAKVCSDDNACTQGDFCDAKDGSCQPGKAKVCDDTNDCTADSCDAKSGLCGFKPIPGCTPSCKVDKDCPPAPGPCSSYKCAGGSGKCQLQPQNDGSVCEPGKVCGGGDCKATGKGWAKQVSGFGYNGRHFCAALNSGKAACWGNNNYGQLGDGSLTERNKPVLVQNIDKVSAVSAGYAHSCAIHDGGKVSCWGYNSYAQIGKGNSSSTGEKEPVNTGLDKAVGVCAGYYHTCAVTSDGKVHCWGSSADGELGNGKTSSGSSDDVTKPAEVKGVSGAVEVACGMKWTCARLASGGLSCWGSNAYNQIHPGKTTEHVSLPQTVSGYQELASLGIGGYHGCFTTAGGQPFCHGYNSYSVASADGKTANVLSPLDLSPLIGAVVHIQGGYQNSVALKPDGTLRIWGYNSYGQLAIGTTKDSNTPVTPTNVDGVVQATLGYHAVCVLKTDGSVHCAGYNLYGQVGSGTSASSVNTLTKVAAEP